MVGSVTVIFCIIAFVFGVLQIVLFFKLWKMTDNISQITSKYLSDNNAAILKDLLLEGRADDAANVIIKQLVAQLKTDIIGTYSTKEERRAQIARSIDVAKEKLVLINKLDSMPKHLESMEKFVDYYNNLQKLFNHN